MGLDGMNGEKLFPFVRAGDIIESKGQKMQGVEIFPHFPPHKMREWSETHCVEGDATIAFWNNLDEL